LALARVGEEAGEEEVRVVLPVSGSRVKACKKLVLGA
jgi:hypothetical protein